MNKILSLTFGIYVAFLLSFNEFLGLFVSKSTLRLVYILMMIVLMGNYMLRLDFKLKLSKSEIIVLMYVIYLFCRYLFQILEGNITQATNIVFFQTIIPILVFFVTKTMSNQECLVIEKVMPVCAVISVVLGILDSKLKILPNVGSFKGGLYGGIGNGIYVIRGYSLAGNALITGFICSLGIGFLLLNRSNNKKEKILKVTIGLILLIGLLDTLSRGAFFMLILILIAPFFSLKKFIQIVTNRRKVLIYSLIFFVAIIVVLFKWEDIVNSSAIKRFFLVSLDMTEGSNSLRLRYQMNAIEKIKSSFLLGKGFGYTGIHAISNNANEYINTESYILTRLVTGGVIDGLCFVVIFIRTLKIKNIDRKGKRYLAILIGMFAWSILYILLDSDLNAIFYWYCLGRVHYYTEDNYESSDWGNKNKVSSINIYT